MNIFPFPIPLTAPGYARVKQRVSKVKGHDMTHLQVWADRQALMQHVLA